MFITWPNEPVPVVKKYRGVKGGYDIPKKPKQSPNTYNGFTIGEMVEYLGEVGTAAQPGATAEVRSIGYSTPLNYNNPRVLYVKWDRNNPLYFDQMDGQYSPRSFKKIKQPSIPKSDSSVENREFKVGDIVEYYPTKDEHKLKLVAPGALAKVRKVSYTSKWGTRYFDIKWLVNNPLCKDKFKKTNRGTYQSNGGYWPEAFRHWKGEQVSEQIVPVVRAFCL